MKMTITQKIIIISIVCLLVVYIVFDKRSKAIKEVVQTPGTSQSTTTTAIPQELINALGPGNYTIKEIPITEGKTPSVPVPNLSRPVTFNATLTIPPEVKEIIRKKIISLQSELKKDTTLLPQWIDLGLYQKMSGDYEGAALSWKYVAAVADKDFISYGNLGDLYAYYLNDKTQSEVFYKKAISNNPTQEYLYLQLAHVYLDVFKDATKARNIVDEGLRVLPGNKNLIQIKDSIQ